MTQQLRRLGAILKEFHLGDHFAGIDDLDLSLVTLDEKDRQRFLSEASDTYRGMPLSGFLKAMEREDFEPVVSFPTARGSLIVHGRERDAILVTADVEDGAVMNATVQLRWFGSPYFGFITCWSAMSENGFDTRQSGCDIAFSAIDGFRLRLMMIAEAPGTVAPLWWSVTPDGTHSNNIVTVADLGSGPVMRAPGFASQADGLAELFANLPDPAALQQGNEVSRMQKERTFDLPERWSYIVDLAGSRTLAEARLMAGLDDGSLLATAPN